MIGRDNPREDVAKRLSKHHDRPFAERADRHRHVVAKIVHRQARHNALRLGDSSWLRPQDLPAVPDEVTGEVIKVVAAVPSVRG